MAHQSQDEIWKFVLSFVGQRHAENTVMNMSWHAAPEISYIRGNEYRTAMLAQDGRDGFVLYDGPPSEVAHREDFTFGARRQRFPDSPLMEVLIQNNHAALRP